MKVAFLRLKRNGLNGNKRILDKRVEVVQYLLINNVQGDDMVPETNIYQYKCDYCKHEWETLEKDLILGDDTDECPKCERANDPWDIKQVKTQDKTTEIIDDNTPEKAIRRWNNAKYRRSNS